MVSKMNTKDDWEDLKFFIALAKERKLKKAAESINSNHTTVYRRISQFEENYNLRLFDRTPAGYSLTAQGEELFEKLTSLDTKMDTIFSSLQGLENKLKGNICITTTPSLALSFLPKAIKKFRNQWPEITIDLKVSNHFFNLSKREADIAIRPATDIPLHLKGRRVGEINFAIFGTSNNKLKINKKNFLKNINQYSFIALDESLSHLSSQQWVDKHINDENIVCRVDNLTIMSKLCSEGVGLAILPQYFSKIVRNIEPIYQPKEFIGNELWVLTHKNLSKTPKIKVSTEFFYHELQNALF